MEISYFFKVTPTGLLVLHLSILALINCYYIKSVQDKPTLDSAAAWNIKQVKILTEGPNIVNDIITYSIKLCMLSFFHLSSFVFAVDHLTELSVVQPIENDNLLY